MTDIQKMSLTELLALKRSGADGEVQAAAEIKRRTSPPTNEPQQTEPPDDEYIYPDDIEPDIKAFNEENFVIDLNGKVGIASFRASRLYDGQFDMIFASVEAFCFKHRNRKKAVAIKVLDAEGNETGEVKYKKVSFVNYWLRNPDIRQYNNGAAFMPYTDRRETGDALHRCLNTFEGLMVRPVAGDWSLFKAHMLDNLCNGNKEYFNYLLNWMAFVVQKRERSEVCVLLRGNEEGTGKGFFATKFGHIFGPHHMQVNNSEHIIGKFNPHLETVILLNADEALFVHDHRQRNALWSLITEPTLTIEPKGRSAYKALNYLNIIITTNASHAVPVGPTARRIFALDVAPHQCGHPEYFDAIDEQLMNGGYEAMLHELLSIDLTGFDVRMVVKTDALDRQKSFSRRGIDGLVEKACSEARVPCAHGRYADFTVTAGAEHRDGFDFFIDSRPREFGCTSLKVKHDLKNIWGCMTGKEARRYDGDRRLTGIQWPPLATLRAAFVKKHGEQEWLVPDAIEWLGDEAKPEQASLNVEARQ